MGLYGVYILIVVGDARAYSSPSPQYFAADCIALSMATMIVILYFLYLPLVMTRRRLQARDYTAGWICALPIELAAAQEMLDEEDECPF